MDMWVRRAWGWGGDGEVRCWNRKWGGINGCGFWERDGFGNGQYLFCGKDEHRVTCGSGGRGAQVDCVVCRGRNLKEMCDCKVILSGCVAGQHRVVVCKVALMVKKKKAEKVGPGMRWWRLGKTGCQGAFGLGLTGVLGDVGTVA